MQFYDSIVVRFADLYQNVTGDSDRALRCLATHADKADPTAVIEATINMAGRETKYDARNEFLEIFKNEILSVDTTQNPLTAPYYIARARESSIAVRAFASELWNSLYPARPMPVYDKLSCI